MKKILIALLLVSTLLFSCSEKSKVSQLKDDEICGLAFYHFMNNFADQFTSTRPYIKNPNRIENNEDKMLFFERLSNYINRKYSEVGFFQYNHKISIITRGEMNKKLGYLPVKILFTYDETQTMWKPPTSKTTEVDFTFKYIIDDYGRKYYVVGINGGYGRNDVTVSVDMIDDLAFEVSQMQTRDVL